MFLRTYHELKSFVLFPSTPCIGSKIFNYNQVVREFTDLENVKCICNEYRGFINGDCYHVVTGNLDIFTNEKLMDILKQGPKYREPVNVDFDLARKTILDNLDTVLNNWADKKF